jgi:ABC-2 type transport system permease protein
MTGDTITTTTASATRRTTRVWWWASARAVVRLTWARTITPILLVSLAVLLLLPILFALVFASRGAIGGDPVTFLQQRFDQLVGAIAVPVLALLLGTSAFAAEADDGTLMYLVSTTTPRWWIVFIRMLFAATGTAVLSALSVWCGGVLVTGLQDPGHVRQAFIVAAVFGAVTYSSAFTMVALVTRRSLVGGLAYVLFWEGVLTATFPGLRYLSIRQWMLAVAGHFTSDGATSAKGGPSVTVALVGGAIVVVMSLVLASQRLARPRLSKIGT